MAQVAAAAKANILPAAMLWSVAAAIIIAYYNHAPTRAWLDWLAERKVQYGFLFSAIGTGLIGGLWPMAFQRVGTKLGLKGVRIEPWRSLPFMVLFWAYRGMEIDALYRLQSWMFRNVHGPWVVVCKTIIDQTAYVMVWAIPTMVFAYLWKDNSYSLGRTAKLFGKGWYRRRCLPVLLANWMVWIPVVSIIYSLPDGLQVPVMNINLCLFVLLVMFLTNDEREVEPAP